ncbi:MAG: TetR/AcrR family transcriptional regulator [Chloroflexota bacterium]
MTPKPDVSEERRNQILEAATAVFARLGFHKARMEDISEEARLSKGALYWYFRSKDAIIDALLKRFFERDFSELRTLLHAEGPASERLLAYARHSAVEIERTAWFTSLSFDILGLLGRQSFVKQYLLQYFKRYQQELGAIVQQGIDAGEFREIDAQSSTITIIGIYEGLLLLWVVDPEMVPLRQSMEGSMRLLLEGMKKER